MMLDEETLALLTNTTFTYGDTMTAGMRVRRGNGGSRPKREVECQPARSCERRHGCHRPPEPGKLGCALHEAMAPHG